MISTNTLTLLMALVVATHAISDSCEKETTALNGFRTAVSTAHDDIVTTRTTEKSTLKLTYSNVGSFELACQATGGRFAEESFDAECTGNADEQTKDYLIRAIDSPFCIGPSCTDEDINELKAIMDDSFQELGGHFTNVDETSFMCSSGVGFSVGAVTAGAFLVTTALNLL